MASIPNNQQNYGFPSPYSPNSKPPIVAKRAPTANDYNYAIGTLWIEPSTSSAYILVSVVSNQATWNLLESGGGAGSFSSLVVSPGLSSLSALTSVGTANINTSGAAVSSIGVGGTGAVHIGNATGNTIISAGNLTATSGNIVATAGNINATAGSMSAGTTVTAGTGITATTGNISATAGNVSAPSGSVTAGIAISCTNGVTGGTLYATGDLGAVASSNSLTNVTETATGAGTVTFAPNEAVGNIVQTGWMKFYDAAGNAAYVPYFESI